MERRRHERHDLSVPVKFDWESTDSNRRYGTGLTRNFSAAGLFILAEDPPPVGSIIYFEADLDTSRLESAVMVQAKGKVERVEMEDVEGRLGGFAVSTRRMRLEKTGVPSE